MLAQSLLSVPPAPGWIDTIAFLLSSSPLKSIEISKFTIFSSKFLASSNKEFIVSSSFSEFASSKSSFASLTAWWASLNLASMFEIFVFSLFSAPALAISCQKSGSCSVASISFSLAFISSGFTIEPMFSTFVCSFFKSSLYS